ncbi:helix-turn-helix domain-containing protein [Desulfosporosinus sp.]|uniref:helix-turn-helix domain-containing protein n=1 Tax=Desulfosporosinus sp. TaxID=157907 RepID=UPI000E9E6FF4|nr:helix-turn-helix domain-containing protein [Desulfosporosinus sp.]MBC2722589.1 helix-turn-helix domain-containing protein [Desulfosporosinus sp.]MBC2727703.1 helix-turn-helix domain-containing protein [Desulfosporosinus sp.]HBV87968.1 DUF4115 domain-containing protein [Desulfosporosinus sp.]
MAGEGQMLRAAREEKEWSLLDTEEITKIRVRYIQALEEEEYGILPGATYVKGYLRTYAKQLGLNPDDIIGLYSSSIKQEVTPVIEEPDRMVVRSHSLWVRPVIIGGMALAAIVLAISIKNLYQPEDIPDSAFTSPPLISAPDSGPTEPSPTVPKTPSQSSPPDVVASTQDGLTAHLVFTQACWIEIKVDNQAPFQGTFAAGSTKEIKGTDKIELVSIGNAGGLTVTLNGKSMPSLGKPGQVLRNIILTKETLNQL